MDQPPRILMCPPTYFGIEYEINAWMSRSRPSDHAEATRQWQALREVLVRVGASIEEVLPVKELPDLVFTANAGLVFRNKVVLSKFLHPQRQREEPVFSEWFMQHGFEVVPPPEGISFEGAGDALFCGETLFAGYRLRSDASGHQRIAETLGCRVLPLELVDPYFYHLDTCFCPIDRETALYYPRAFDEYARRALQEAIPRLIAVEEPDARRFGCNAVVVGRHVVTNTGCESLHHQLREHGCEPWATPLDEFLKSGGSAKCLTLRLDGEDAATWKFETT